MSFIAIYALGLLITWPVMARALLISEMRAWSDGKIELTDALEPTGYGLLLAILWPLTLMALIVMKIVARPIKRKEE
ncbi:MAG: hypothetical protein ACTH4Y_11505 [Microbacterium gubbeenense]|uniref:hypothetical protein n=1 Tax=Microbacterium gubbeenense TaxID=159896 RepID=UPI003F94FF05